MEVRQESQLFDKVENDISLSLEQLRLWVNDRFSTNVIRITIEPARFTNSKERLSLVFELDEQEKKFTDGYLPIGEAKQDLIFEKIEAIIHSSNTINYNTSNLCIITNSQESIMTE